MDIKAFRDKLFESALKNDFKECEIFFVSGSAFSAKILNGRVDEYKNTFSRGLSFRGLHGGKMGYSYTERIEDNVIPLLLNNAMQNAEIIEEAEPERLFSGSKAYMPAPIQPADTLSPEEKIALALKMEENALKADKRVKSVLHCMVATGESETYISNTLGLDLNHRVNHAMAYVSVQAQENDQVKVGYEFYLGNDFSGLEPEQLAKNAVNAAVSYLGAKTMESGKYSVIFKNTAASDLFSVFAGVFYAENVQKGFSLLKDKLGEKIAAECVGLKDDGVYPFVPINTPFDSEGVATQNKAVIENGVLKTYLYNSKSAAKDGVKSTGNGFKPSFKSPVSTSHTNFYIMPSDTDFNALLGKMGTGVLITELAGLHSGANAISGNFSLSADGFFVENGRIVRPVEQITVAGNFFDMLKTIAAVGSDLRFDTPGAGGSIGMPSILISELNIAGL